ncbi:MAG: patatin-like phospholipase family protein [Synechococcus sp.]
MTVWGPLAKRYEGKADQPHKLLALDGGGIRGIIPLKVLVRMESMLKEALGADNSFRLCQFFDYIAGTSTGAIIAAGLSLGKSAQELLEFYIEVGPQMFEERFILQRVNSLYKADPLRNKLEETFGAETTLEPKYLKCLMLAVTRNHTTDSPWPITSNPLAKYNDTSRPDCNLKIPIWNIVRASTAAPVFFPPEKIVWDEHDPSTAFLFVDGGMTPYNNPAFVLYRMATDPAYKLKWATGEDKLLLMSIGTGLIPSTDSNVRTIDRSIVQNLPSVISALMNSAAVEQDISCRQIGRCVHGDAIDRELGDMIPRDDKGEMLPLSENQGKKFLYARYNIDISQAGLDAAGLSNIQAKSISKLDSVTAIPQLKIVGEKVSQQLKPEHFGSFVPS